MDKKAFLDSWDMMNDVVFEVVTRLQGSISAEHGIGRLRRHRLLQVKSPVVLDVMRGLKRLLDPNNILNPGKVVPD
jgi:D-lactate dehydrogenase (cytochrome)